MWPAIYIKFLNELAGNEMPPEVMVPSKQAQGSLNVDLQALAKLPEVSQTSTKSKSAALKSILKSFGKKNLYSAHLDSTIQTHFFTFYMKSYRMISKQETILEHSFGHRKVNF